jgi:hypothetical protein
MKSIKLFNSMKNIKINRGLEFDVTGKAFLLLIASIRFLKGFAATCSKSVNSQGAFVYYLKWLICGNFVLFFSPIFC